MAVTLNHTKKQWVDLGVHTEACMTRPETCGAPGGAISVWINAIECPVYCGIMSTDQASGSSGLAIILDSDEFTYDSNITH